jgi:hypothetical protein
LIGFSAQELPQVLDDPDCVSLSVTIRFTNNGLSIGRNGDGSAMHLHTKPRRDPDEASMILSLFAGIGVRPAVDYLSDGGRTRLMQFPIAEDCDAIVRLCERVLTEVYSMRRGDFSTIRR